jgi:hypothetical protein
MKEVWTYLGASLPGTQTQLKRIARASALAAYEIAVAQICDICSSAAASTWRGVSAETLDLSGDRHF